jgi:hypothetical protein
MTKLITAPNSWIAAYAVNKYIQDKYPDILRLGLVLPHDWKEKRDLMVREDYDLVLKKEFELGEKLAVIVENTNIIPGDSRETIGFWRRYFAERLDKRLPDSYIQSFISAYQREEAQLVVAPNYMKEQMEESLETKAEVFVNNDRRPDSPLPIHINGLFL